MITLEKWLNEKLKSMFNPQAHIISKKEEKLKDIKKILSKVAKLILQKMKPLKTLKLKITKSIK